MGLMDFLSGATNAATHAASGQQAGELEGKRLSSQLMSAALTQEERRAQTDYFKSRANLNAARTPTADIYEHLRNSLLDAGNEPEDVEAAIAAARAGNRSGLNALFAPPKPPASRILRTPGGYVRSAPGQPAEAITDANGNPVMPVISPRGAGRAANPNAESPAHRNARQGVTAVNSQIRDDTEQMRAMDRAAPPLVQYPGVVTGSPADSADARAFTAKRRAIQTHADSLRGVRNGLSGQLTGGGVATQPAAPVGQAGQPDYDGEAQLYQDAIAKIRQTYANDPAQMQTRLQQASDRYNQRVRAITPRR